MVTKSRRLTREGRLRVVAAATGGHAAEYDNVSI